MLTLALYLAFVNIVAGLFMAYDKWAAPLGHRRVPEKTLFGLALIGATPTIFYLMNLLRHKSNKASFRWRMNVVMAIQLGALILYSFIAALTA